MKTLRASFFSLLVNLIKTKMLHFLIAQPGCKLLYEGNNCQLLSQNTLKKIMKIQHASTSRFHNPKLSQERYFILYMSALQDYLKGALRKKQLIASFVEQFKLNFESTRCIDFQCLVAKFSQQRFMQFVYYTRLCTRYSREEAIDSFFRKAPKRKAMKTL